MTGNELARLVLDWAKADDFVMSGGWGREYNGELIDNVWENLKTAMVAGANEIVNETKRE